MARKPNRTKATTAKRSGAARTTGKRRRQAKRKTPRVSDTSIPRDTIGRAVQHQIDRFGLSRNATAPIVDDAASQVSRMMTGHFDEFSVDRMATWLTRLGGDVLITIRLAERRGRRGKVRVRVS